MCVWLDDNVVGRWLANREVAFVELAGKAALHIYPSSRIGSFAK